MCDDGEEVSVLLLLRCFLLRSPGGAATVNDVHMVVCITN